MSANDAGWQRAELVIDDESVKFDDTFRITARSAPNLSVLALNEGQPSPYIQAAFRAYNGFRLNNANIANPLANPNATTTYLVSYDDGFGCGAATDSTDTPQVDVPAG